MKQYTTPEQTDKLIELGFEQPILAYSIGDLMEILPNVVESEDSEYATLQIYFDLFNWIIEYTDVEEIQHATSAIELIDALYDMILKLRKEGMI